MTARKPELHWKALFVFRNRSKLIFIDGDLPPECARKQFKIIARENHWRLLKVFKGRY